MALAVKTVKEIEALAPRAARYEVKVADPPCLWLCVFPTGAHSFLIRYKLAGKARKMTLGAIGLAEARTRTREALVLIAAGVDPATRQAAQRLAQAQETAAERETVDAAKGRAPDRVEAVVEAFIEKHCAKLRTGEAVARVLRRDAAAPWKGRRLSEITRADVHDVLDVLIARGAPTQANRLYAYLSKMFGWAVSRGIIENNPCTAVEKPSKENTRERVLSDDELATIWRAAESMGPPFGAIVQLLILTGQRKSEVSDMREGEIDREAAMLRLPKERVKNGRPHDVPLSAQAVAIIDATPCIESKDGLLFTSNGKTGPSGFSKWKAEIDAEIEGATGKPLDDWTLHDIRRSVATGLARIGVALVVIERVLNHASGSFGGIVGVYQKHTYEAEMRAALEAWARHIERVLSGEAEPSNIIELAGARK